MIDICYWFPSVIQENRTISTDFSVYLRAMLLVFKMLARKHLRIPNKVLLWMRDLLEKTSYPKIHHDTIKTMQVMLKQNDNNVTGPILLKCGLFDAIVNCAIKCDHVDSLLFAIMFH